MENNKKQFQYRARSKSNLLVPDTFLRFTEETSPEQTDKLNVVSMTSNHIPTKEHKEKPGQRRSSVSFSFSQSMLNAMTNRDRSSVDKSEASTNISPIDFPLNFDNLERDIPSSHFSENPFLSSSLFFDKLKSFHPIELNSTYQAEYSKEMLKASIEEPVMFDSLINSKFFKHLHHITQTCSSEACFSTTKGILLSIEEIENELFWDASLQEFAESRIPNLQQKKISMNTNDIKQQDSFNEHSIADSIPSVIGFRNRLTLWQTVMGRLIERAILATVYLEYKLDITLSTSLLNNPRFLNPEENLKQQQLIAFHQAVLWSCRVIRLSSLFSSAASKFGMSIINTHVYNINDYQTPGNSQLPTVVNAKLLPSDHPLCALRQFMYDRVFISADPNSELGGGFIGILVFGSSTVDVDTACKIYGKELQAQRYLTEHILGLKMKYGRERARMNPKKNNDISLQYKEGQLPWYFSVSQWISNPLTILSPLLMSIVDYRGFRIVVYPLFYRPPMRVSDETLRIGTRLSQELYDLGDTLHLPSPESKNNTSGYQLIQLARNLPAVIGFHKAHHILIREVPFGETNSVDDTSNLEVSMLRPTLIRHFQTLKLTPAQINYRRNPQDIILENKCGIQTSKLLDNSNRLYEMLSLLFNDSFGNVVFNRSKFRSNPFIVPEPSQIGLADIILDQSNIPTPAILSRFLHTVIIPRALHILEGQPFFTPYDSITLRAWLRSTGINCRHLGHLLNMTRHAWVRQVLVVEVVARTLKHLLNDCIRAAMFSSDMPSANSQYPVTNYATSTHRKDSLHTDAILNSLPIPREFAVLLFQDFSFATNLTHSEGGPSVLSLPEIIGLNIIRITLASNPTSLKLWKTYISPFAKRRFGANECYIQPHNCPPVALAFSLQHHTGMRLNIDPLSFASRLEASVASMQFATVKPQDSHVKRSVLQASTHPPISTTFGVTGLSILKPADVEGWNPSIKPSMNYDNLQAVLPIFDLLKKCQLIPLLTGEENKNTNLLENSKSEDISRNVTIEQRLRRQSSDSLELYPQLLDMHPFKQNERKETELTVTGTVAQTFVAASLCVSASSSSDLNFLSQRSVSSSSHAKLNSIDNDLKKFKGLTTASEGETDNTDCTVLYHLTPKLMSDHIYFINSSTIHFIYDKTSCWKMQMAFLDLVLWAMYNNLWDIAQLIAIDCLRLYTEGSIASVFCRWNIIWIEILRCSGTLQISLQAQKALHQSFALILDLISCYWDIRHPLITDTLLAFIWCLYVIRDKNGIQLLLKAAINHAIDIMTYQGLDDSLTVVDTAYFPTYPRHIFDPFSIPIINSIPPTGTGAKLGQLFRLLGTTALAEAACLSSNILESDLLTAGGSRTHPPIPGKNETIFKLCNIAVEASRTAVRILSHSYKEQSNTLLLADAEYELASGLLLKMKLTVQDYGGIIKREALILSLLCFKKRYHILPERHIEIIQSALQLVLILESHQLMSQALPLWDQLLRDVTLRQYEKHAYQKNNTNDESLCRHISQINSPDAELYRPTNILSLLLTCLPNQHFLGIHEVLSDNIIDDERLTTTKMNDLIKNVIESDIIPTTETIKSRILPLYLNACIPHNQIVRLLRLFQKIQNIEEYLSVRPNNSTNNYENINKKISWTNYDNNHLPKTILEYHSFGGKEERIMLEFVNSYPNIIPYGTLLSGDGAMSLYTPLLSGSFLKVKKLSNSSGLFQKEVLDAGLSGNTHLFFTQLVEQCEIDLKKFHTSIHKRSEKHKDVDTFTTTESSPGSSSSSSSPVSDIAGEQDTLLIRTEKDKKERIKDFLEFKRPLEAYNMTSINLDILCSLIYWFLDIKGFHQLCMNEKIRHESSRAMEALGYPTDSSIYNENTFYVVNDNRSKKLNAYECVIQELTQLGFSE